MNRILVVILLTLTAIVCAASAQAPEKPAPPTSGQTNPQELKPAQADEGKMLSASRIKAGSRVFVAPMEGGFDNFIVAGIQKKKVPVVIVIDRTKADYEITGISDSEKAGWAKMLFLGSQQSREEASIKVSDLKTSTIVFAYSVNKGNSYKGRQSAGEACAKHLREIID